MSDATNKPRDIKNLKARLGKTVTPGQIGQPGPRAPSAPPTGGSAPAFGAPPPRPVSMPPGGGSAPAFGAPVARPLSAPSAPKVGVPVPSFAQPKAAPVAATPAQPARPADPFAASSGRGVVAAEKQIRLVIDGSAVDESEIGRKSLTRGIVVAAVGVALGIALGYALGSTVGDRNMFRLAVQDGKDIYAKVQEVSKGVETAKTKLKDALNSMTPGTGAKIDYGAIEALIALPKPFSANAFHRKRYGAFKESTVDDLFDYYNNVNILWGRFEGMAAKTTPKKRELLNQSAQATEELMTAQYGLNPFTVETQTFGRLVYVTIPPPAPDQEGPPETVQVSSTQGGRAVDKTLYAGQPEIAEKPDNFVILIEKGQSMSILGQPSKAFSEIRADFVELNAIMAKTMETQGRLLTELGQIATLSP